ncbi:MAG TPA: hypothetical protein VGZ73_14170 [Bryobacteraceae bacterium]|jgi:hypothetical protein|nr:hypothetical protein [Bryobacteraceae bacterium]
MIAKWSIGTEPSGARVDAALRGLPGAELYYEAWSIAEETGWSFYDSLMVSAALAAGCGLIHGRPPAWPPHSWG